MGNEVKGSSHQHVFLCLPEFISCPHLWSHNWVPASGVEQKWGVLKSSSQAFVCPLPSCWLRWRLLEPPQKLHAKGDRTAIVLGSWITEEFPPPSPSSPELEAFSLSCDQERSWIITCMGLFLAAAFLVLTNTSLKCSFFHIQAEPDCCGLVPDTRFPHSPQTDGR